MKNHFDGIADIYDSIWHFSDTYKEWMLSHILKILKFDKDDIFVDIGGGTAVYTKLILENSKLIKKAYCIEPSIKMSNIAKKYKDIIIYNENSNIFSKRELTYDKILIKEAIHHIQNRRFLWNNLYKNINLKGQILIITRPQNIRLPLFKKARDVFYQNQPSFKTLQNELEKEKFDVNISFDTYNLKIKKEIWLYMIRQRFMSDLGCFSDKEIDKGIQEINKNIKSDKLNINDDIIFINALKRL
jgi:hypothetical protein